MRRGECGSRTGRFTLWYRVLDDLGVGVGFSGSISSNNIQHLPEDDFLLISVDLTFGDVDIAALAPRLGESTNVP